MPTLSILPSKCLSCLFPATFTEAVLSLTNNTPMVSQVVSTPCNIPAWPFHFTLCIFAVEILKWSTGPDTKNSRGVPSCKRKIVTTRVTSRVGCDVTPLWDQHHLVTLTHSSMSTFWWLNNSMRPLIAILPCLKDKGEPRCGSTCNPSTLLGGRGVRMLWTLRLPWTIQQHCIARSCLENQIN